MHVTLCTCVVMFACLPSVWGGPFWTGWHAASPRTRANDIWQWRHLQRYALHHWYWYCRNAPYLYQGALTLSALDIPVSTCTRNPMLCPGLAYLLLLLLLLLYHHVQGGGTGTCGRERVRCDTRVVASIAVSRDWLQILNDTPPW